MGYFRFWRRMKIAPGVTLNISKSGLSVSLGIPGAKYTVGGKGTRTTFGIPGSGLFYTSSKSWKSRRFSKKSTNHTDMPVKQFEQPTLDPGFFERLLIPADHEDLIDACRNLNDGNTKKALHHAKKANKLADGAFLAGILELRRQNYVAAKEELEQAQKQSRGLGRTINKYDLSLVIDLPIAEDVIAHIKPSLQGTLLALVEVYQALEHYDDAMTALEHLRLLQPDDPVARLSLCELLMGHAENNPLVYRRVLRLTAHIKNKSSVHAAILLYRARAFLFNGNNRDAEKVVREALNNSDNYPLKLKNALQKIYQE